MGLKWIFYILTRSNLLRENLWLTIEPLCANPITAELGFTNGF
jgi:hypothetical protein